MAIPARPCCSDLLYLYSFVCYACTSSTLFRPSIFVLCNGYSWSTLFRRSIIICILLFVITVLRKRSSDLLYLYSFVCDDCTLSTLFRPKICVLVCLWWLYFVYAFQSYCICLFLMSILHPRFSNLPFAVASTRFRAAIFVLVCFWWIYLFHAFESCRICTPVCDVYNSSTLFLTYDIWIFSDWLYLSTRLFLCCLCAVLFVMPSLWF